MKNRSQYPSLQDIADTWTLRISYRVEVDATLEMQEFDTLRQAKAFARKVKRTFADEAMLIRLVKVTEKVTLL